MTPAIAPWIVGLGARSPLGLSALQVALCARAQKLEPRSTQYTDHRGHLVGAARSVCLSDDLHGFERFAALGAPALREATQRLSLRAPLVLSLPDRARPDQSERFEGELCSELARRSGAAIDREASRIVRADNAGFGMALGLAQSMLAAGAPAVIAGGVDSYFDPVVLAWLDEDRRLFSQHSEEGIVPSEGAAFFVLARPDLKPGALGPRSLGPKAVVAHAATAREETVVTGEPNAAQAMTALARAAIAASRAKLSWLVTDVNGERHRVREASLVESRIAGEVAEDGTNEALADALGDVGAATGALHLAVAITRMGTGSAPARSALFLQYAEGPERAAFLVEAP